MKRKVSYFRGKDVITGMQIKFAKVILYKEPMNIRGVKFKMDNVYNVPAEDVDQPDLYEQPIHDLNYNIRRAFRIYRNKMGMLEPADIRYIRERIGLSQYDVSLLTGIKRHDIQDIEAGHVVQSVEQDTVLRAVFNTNNLAVLIPHRIASAKARLAKRSEINRLEQLEKRYSPDQA